MALSNFSESIFREQIVGRVDVDDNIRDELSLWWQENQNVEKYIKQFELAVKNCHTGPEKTDGNRIAKKLRRLFNETNLLYSKLLNLKTNFFFELWYWPIVGFFLTRPENVVISKIMEVIEQFKDVIDGNQDDQVLAVLEVIASVPLVKLPFAKQKILEWSCEEFFHLYEHEKLRHLADLDQGTTADEYQTERAELKDAVNSKPWKYEEKQKIIRKLRRIRKAMDKFCVDTQAKRDLNDLIKYLEDGISNSTSIVAVLQNTEYLFDTLVSDSTQQEFWEWEAEDNEED